MSINLIPTNYSSIVFSPFNSSYNSYTEGQINNANGPVSVEYYSVTGSVAPIPTGNSKLVAYILTGNDATIDISEPNSLPGVGLNGQVISIFNNSASMSNLFVKLQGGQTIIIIPGTGTEFTYLLNPTTDPVSGNLYHKIGISQLNNNVLSGNFTMIISGNFGGYSPIPDDDFNVGFQLLDPYATDVRPQTAAPAAPAVPGALGGNFSLFSYSYDGNAWFSKVIIFSIFGGNNCVAWNGDYWLIVPGKGLVNKGLFLIQSSNGIDLKYAEINLDLIDDEVGNIVFIQWSSNKKLWYLGFSQNGKAIALKRKVSEKVSTREELVSGTQIYCSQDAKTWTKIGVPIIPREIPEKFLSKAQVKTENTDVDFDEWYLQPENITCVRTGTGNLLCAGGRYGLYYFNNGTWKTALIFSPFSGLNPGFSQGRFSKVRFSQGTTNIVYNGSIFIATTSYGVFSSSDTITWNPIISDIDVGLCVGWNGFQWVVSGISEVISDDNQRAPAEAVTNATEDVWEPVTSAIASVTKYSYDGINWNNAEGFGVLPVVDEPILQSGTTVGIPKTNIIFPPIVSITWNGSFWIANSSLSILGNINMNLIINSSNGINWQFSRFNIGESIVASRIPSKY
jgi:hypothetical protein